MFRISILVFLLLLSFGCSKIRKVTDEITKPSARQVYSREFDKNDRDFSQWTRAYEIALSDSILVTAPYVERSFVTSQSKNVHSYNLMMSEGEILTVSVKPDSLNVFIDIVDVIGTSPTVLNSNEPDTAQLDHVISETGRYKVIVQPEMAFAGLMTILIQKSPLFSAPVSGKGNSAIQSFWGYERDGGTRSHEGVDIFAPRGTPVVAVTGITHNTVTADSEVNKCGCV
ncbi:MAG: hypothetical protein ITG00_04740 [Flavobacterium sp.]|nr:hypothetical protein [Flavobacterium sp.]